MGGVWEVVLAAFRVAKFVRLIPVTVVHGFLNGLAIIIAIAQAHSFQAPHEKAYVWQSKAAGGWPTLGLTLMLIAVTIALVHVVPRLTTRVLALWWPSASRSRSNRSCARRAAVPTNAARAGSVGGQPSLACSHAAAAGRIARLALSAS